MTDLKGEAVVFRWIKAKVDQRLRHSQQKIVYLNYKALEFVQDFFSPTIELGGPSAAEIAKFLEDLKFLTVDAIFGLAWQTILDDRKSRELVTVNDALKRQYADIQNARAAITNMGGTKPPLPPFAEKFQPSGGWTKFRDSDSEEMMAWAVEQSQKEQMRP